MVIPKSIQNLIEAFERLPGIGPKTAARLVYYLLHAPASESQKLAKAAAELKEKTVLCSICRNIAEEDPCPVCLNPKRDKTIICVVEEPLDVLALERANFFGLYHVLHGAISPMQNLGPDELHIKELLPRLKDGIVKEIILATNPSMEGEATAMYIAREVKRSHFAKASRDKQNAEIKITRIGRGLPMGGEVEYADEVTLSRALEGRREY